MNLNPWSKKKSLSLVTGNGIPPTKPDPKILIQIQSTDRSLLLIKHEAALVDYKEKWNAQADRIAKFRTTHISPNEIPSAPVQLIPANCVDISTLTQHPDEVLNGKYILCRTIAPSYRSYALKTIVEDPRGQQGIRLSLYNYDAVLKELPVAQILAIKNPWFKAARNGELSLECENPEDIVVIPNKSAQEIFPGVKWEGEISHKWKVFIQTTPETSIEWKNQGNKEFVLEEYAKAIQSYTEGLKLTDGVGSDKAVQITCDMLSNRAACYLKFDCFQSALEDLEKLLKIDPTHFKGLYRKGKALMGLQRFQEAVVFLELSSSLPNLDSKNQKLIMELLKWAQTLLKQQQTGEYDMLKLYKAGDVRHEYCADFVGPVKIQKIKGSRNGSGIVATQDIKPGQLISATKAFQIVFPKQDQTPCAVRVNSTPNVRTLSPRECHEQIVEKITQKLTLEPNLCRSVYELYAGPDLPIFNAKKDPLVVDLERIEAIDMYNTFMGNMPDFEKIANGTAATDVDRPIGIWIFPSFFNHRCSDLNTIWTTFGDMLFMRALKEIPVGTEILISYVDPTHLYETREKILKGHGFVCNCQLCQIDRDDSKKGRKRMELLKRIEKCQNSPSKNLAVIEILMKKIWELGKSCPKQSLKLNPSLIYPLHDLGQSCFMSNQYEKAVDLLMKRYVLTTNSGMKQLAMESCFHLITVHLMDRNVEEAKNWTKKLREEMLILYGTLDIAQVMTRDTLTFMAQHKIFVQE